MSSKPSVSRFSLVVDNNLMIKRVSQELSYYKQALIGGSFKRLCELVYDLEDSPQLDELLKKLKQRVQNNTVFEQRFYSFKLNNFVKVSFYLLTISMIDTHDEEYNITFKDVVFEDSLTTIYHHFFDSFDTSFNVLKDRKPMGRFIINPNQDIHLLYGNESMPQLFSISPNLNNEYGICESASNEGETKKISFSETYHIQIPLLLNGDIDYLKADMKINDKWLQVNAKMFQLHTDSPEKIIGGIVLDVTESRTIEDMHYIQSIYNMAITAGDIGIFYYDLDKHSSQYFEANDIYAKMIGIDPNEAGRYKLSDFTKALLQVEDEISENEDIVTSLNKLLEGQLDGTNDDIIKIQHLKTQEILYLLSSSKVNQYFPDGKPKRFGGIIIDITDRIEKEKFQREFAYKDELTKLGNNRRLQYDMKNRDEGIGLFFDLDDFKQINDQYGHLMGDRMLKQYAKALMNAAVDVDNVYIYRLYGDEFFVFAEGKDLSFAKEYEQKVISYLQHIKDVSDEDITLNASMGVALYHKEDTIDDFIKSADYDMYKTKIDKKSKR